MDKWAGTRTDDRVVYGATCRWWDTIDKASTTDAGLPCCPHCGSVLYEVESLAAWWANVDRFEAAGHPGYRADMEAIRGQCDKAPGGDSDLADVFDRMTELAKQRPQRSGMSDHPAKDAATRKAQIEARARAKRAKATRKQARRRGR